MLWQGINRRMNIKQIIMHLKGLNFTMKKVLCVLMAAGVIATSSVTAFAATISSATGTDSADVKGKYVTRTQTDIYSVNVTWGAMEFDYYEGGQKWNTTTHKWEGDTEDAAGWTVNNESNTITLANNSSVAVNASFAFAANTEYTDLTGAFTYDNAALTSALNLELPQEDTAAKNYVVSFMPDGSIPNTHSTSTYAKMGTITVTLS